MKKNYLFLAAATTLFAACVQTDVVTDIPEPQQQAISFETFANKQTRAENSSATAYNDLSNHHTSFYVWASKQVADNTQSPASTKYVSVYADATPGTVGFSSSSWTASPLKYWDKTATSYEFYAAAPAVQNTTTPAYGWVATNTNGASGYLTFNNFVLKGEAKDNLASVSSNSDSWKDLIKTVDGTETKPNDIDLMIAAPNTVVREKYNKEIPEKVNMEFNHILSRLNIMVKKGDNIDNDHELKLNSLVVYNLKNQGTFNENAAVADKTPKISRWSQQTLANNTRYELSAASVTSGITTDAVYTHQYLIIPQTVRYQNIDMDGSDSESEAYFRIEYTIEDEVYFGFYNLAYAFGQNETLNFQEGYQNTLTIIINPNSVVFDASVSEWQDYVKPEFVVK